MDILDRVSVALGERSYSVVIASTYSALVEELRRVLEFQRVIVVSDDHVAPLYLPEVRQRLIESGFEVSSVVLPAGEENKTLAVWQTVLDEILAAGAQRRIPILALGGGVVGDIAGFAAATALRGLPLVQLPTTLLAMVDASIGGKTGVNHESGKNLVGAYHQPKLVYAALDTLSTLDMADYRAGLGEVVKAAIIGDARLFSTLEESAPDLVARDSGLLAEVVARCVKIKVDVVEADELDFGWRAVLNAGHTVAHALERATGFGHLRHGEAVAWGLVAEARWAVRKKICPEPDLP
ncbi:MAG: 3-dehydroquinate synthase, partial [Proteobacteria bacterium]|nr:3-dehydroquinate synthase [Pseudomonadota bacterium]